jgi:hypothetical protein
MTRLKITDEMREAAHRLLRTRGVVRSGADRARLADIVDGKRKVIDALWWAKFYQVIDQQKLDKLERLADPARNSNEHERELAGRKAAEFKAHRPPGSRL